MTTLILTAAQLAAINGGGLTLMPPTAAVEPPPTTVPSANDTLVTAPSTALITDAAGNTWGINVAEYVTINGTADMTTSNVIELAYVDGLVWQQNHAGMWYSKAAPTAAWSKGITVSPLPLAPPIAPPAPSTGGVIALKVPIFQDGKLEASGDWNGGGTAMNYAFSADGLNGKGPVIDWPAYPGNPYWLPYYENTAASNVGNPSANLYGYNVTGCTHLTCAFRPAATGLDILGYLYQAQGTANDEYYGPQFDLTQEKYLVSGPGISTPGEWSVYSMPLADVQTPVLDWYYKINLGKHGTNPTVDVQLDQVGFY